MAECTTTTRRRVHVIPYGMRSTHTRTHYIHHTQTQSSPVLCIAHILCTFARANGTLKLCCKHTETSSHGCARAPARRCRKYSHTQACACVCVVSAITNSQIICASWCTYELRVRCECACVYMRQHPITHMRLCSAHVIAYCTTSARRFPPMPELRCHGALRNWFP